MVLGFFWSVHVAPVEVAVERLVLSESVHGRILPSAIAHNQDAVPLKVGNESGGVSRSGAFDLLVCVEEKITMHATVRIDKVNGVLAIVLQGLQHLRAIAHEIEAADQL